MLRQPPALARLVACLALLALLAPPPPADAAPLAGRDPRDDVFYQIMPIAWRDSDNDAQRFGDFGGMTASLPYLQYLGVTAMWMTPIFDSPAYHGYQHMPANTVNPRFGTEAQFLAFVNAAHADSIKVFVDWVAYTVSQNSLYFTDSHLNPTSVYTDYLAYTDAHVANSAFVGGAYPTWNGATVGDIRWNLNNPAVVALQDAWTAHWLDPNGDGDPADGIDGYRLDHVLADEGWGYNLAFWQQWKNAMRAVNPSVFTFPEQADWGTHGNALLGAHDAAFTMPFMFAARAAIAAETAAGLYSEMKATVASLPAGKLYLGLLGNHDVDRLSSNTGNVAGHNKVAAAILMTQPFPPIVYFGDELGMRGTKANYGSDANDIPFREPFKWSAVAGPPMSNYFVLNASAYGARVERNNDGRSVQEQQGVAGSLLETYRSLIALRRDHPALRRGGYDEVPNANPATWAFARYAGGQESLLVAINLSGVAVNTTLDLSTFEVTDGSSPVRDVVSGAALPALTTANRGAYALAIPAYSWRVLSARVKPGPPPPPSPYDGSNIPADFSASAPVVTQTTATAMGDNVNELDQLFLRPETGGLAVAITGNLDLSGTALALFLDTLPGGQDSLQTSSFPQPPSGVPGITGLGMDAGFAPDRLLWINLYGGTVFVDHYTLATGGGGVHRYLGATAANAGSPLLSGGTNTNGLQAAWNDSNTAGVTATSAAGAASASAGFEALVPWADLGLAGPGTDVRVMAAIVQGSGAFGNQFLPPLGPGAASVGFAPFSLKTVPGQQYVTIPTTLGVPAATGLRVGVRAAPNPFRDSASFRFSLPHADRVRVEVLDVAGRRVRALGTRFLDAGPHALAWDGRDDGGRPVDAGLYFVRLVATGWESRGRLVRLAPAR
jgi:glycosidase